MEGSNLYTEVRQRICRKIFEGSFREGELIPPERQLCEALGVSRITLRKALTLLETEGIISKTQGSGTRVSLNFDGHKGDMDIITLVAPAQNAFFSRFIDAFETEAEKRGSLVLFKQKPQGIALETCLFQLYERGLRNIVLWPENMRIDPAYMRLLRGLGMNIVCFDTVDGGPYADAVCLDNHDAIRRLYDGLTGAGCKRIGYIGWDNYAIGSVREREKIYRKLAPVPAVVCVPYRYHDQLRKLPDSLISQGRSILSGCDGVICSAGEFESVFEGGRLSGIIDDLPEHEPDSNRRIRQNFPEMVRRIFQCLDHQNDPNVKWTAENHYITGENVAE